MEKDLRGGSGLASEELLESWRRHFLTEDMAESIHWDAEKNWLGFSEGFETGYQSTKVQA